MDSYYTTGQVAKKLRVSASTIKRWIETEGALNGSNTRNAAGWRLFSSNDLDCLRKFKTDRRRSGRQFKPSTLKPVY